MIKAINKHFFFASHAARLCLFFENKKEPSGMTLSEQKSRLKIIHSLLNETPKLKWMNIFLCA